MANAVNNLRVNGEEVKGIMFKRAGEENYTALRELHYNNVLVWKSSHPFYFIPEIKGEMPKYDSNTMLFVGFSPDSFKGDYIIIDESELKNPKPKQMVVVQTTENEVNK